MPFLGKKGTKTLSINVDHHPTQLSRTGEPLFYGTPENPVVISAEVIFESDKDCSGQDLQVDFATAANVAWGEHTAAGKIKAGIYRSKISIPINPSTPSSMTLEKGWVQYKIEARISRKGLSSDIVQEKVVWVFNSNLDQEARLGGNLHPCVIHEDLDDKDDDYDPELDEEVVIEGQTSWVHNFSVYKTDSDKPTSQYLSEKPKSGSEQGPLLTCEIPTTTFMAGETIAVVVESVPRPGSFATDAVSVISYGDQRGLLSGLTGTMARATAATDEAPSWPQISIRLKQTIWYRDMGGEAKFPERTIFGCIFKKESSGPAYSTTVEGWRDVYNLILPRLEHDELNGLKPSVNCKSLAIKHLLKIELTYKKGLKSSVRKFKSKGVLFYLISKLLFV
ncbi:hypothetical protein BGZ58_008225 [Dissophora ornata]|nr:hypothetical protein BGZ58_008225 [Dissophora ornata]